MGKLEDIWVKSVYKDTRLELQFKEGNTMLNIKMTYFLPPNFSNQDLRV